MSFTVRDLPEELVQPIKALTDETRRRILISLLEKDSAHYSDIKNNFQIKNGTLNHHLHILVSSGLIRNFSIKIPGNPYNSYYAITDFGRKFMAGLRQTLEPEVVERTFTFTSATFSDKIVIGSTSQGEEKQPEIYPIIETLARS